MDISDILSEDMVITGLEAESKRKLLEKLSGLVAQKKGLDGNTVFDAILERENLGSTGYGNGVAFPHARINGLDKVIVAVCRLAEGVDYDALDAKPVDIVALMLSPENSGEDHLRSLALLSRVLKDENVCQKVRNARTTHEIYLCLQK